jgi:hypothetical protein
LQATSELDEEGPYGTYSCLGEVGADFELIYDNCALFNERGSGVVRDAKKVKKEGLKLVKRVVPEAEKDSVMTKLEEEEADGAGAGAGKAVHDGKGHTATANTTATAAAVEVKVAFDPLPDGTELPVEFMAAGGEALSKCLWVDPVGSAASKSLLTTGPYRFDVVVTSYETLTSPGGRDLQMIPVASHAFQNKNQFKIVV